MLIGPQNSQTGPAIRRDQKTIDKHIDLLIDDDLKKLYLILTNSIQKNMSQKNYKILLNNVRAFVFDIDGVMTNGKVLITTEGEA